ncbi:MAG TPA: caspase family protein, partial [Aggregatilineales bacterium]|nr:caspase family protein [Aggregatilineales bacterium]
MNYRKYALLIGSHTFEYADHFPPLRTPAQNVEKLAALLQDPEIGGFAEGDVRMLINRPYKEVRRAIINLFKDKTYEDYLLLYYSGHGFKPGGRLFYAVTDSEPEYPEDSAIADAELKEAIRASNSKRIVVILDCCHSGAALKSGAMAAGDAALDLTENLDHIGFGRVFMTASGATQQAWEFDQPGDSSPYSVFSRFLLEGLAEGAADTDDDTNIYTRELYDFIHHRIKESFPALNMTPGYSFGEGTSDLLIARNPRPRKLSEDIRKRLRHESYKERRRVIVELEDVILENRTANPLLAEEAERELAALSQDADERVRETARRTLEGIRGLNAPPPTTGTVIKRLFISSPNDVKPEREIVKRVATKLNDDPEFRGRLSLETVAWEDDESAKRATISVQGNIDRNLPKPEACDIVTVIFWSRIGSELPQSERRPNGPVFQSGTVGEYLDARDAPRQRPDDPPALFVYRAKRQPELTLHDPLKFGDELKQLTYLNDFLREEFQPGGQYVRSLNEYNDLPNFEILIEKHLRAELRRQMMPRSPDTEDAPAAASMSAARVAAPSTQDDAYTAEDVQTYLNWAIEQHTSLELRGLGEGGSAPTIPLEKVFVALKGNRASAAEYRASQSILTADIFEREDMREVLEEFAARSEGFIPIELLVKELQDRELADNPAMPTLQERDRAVDDAEKPITLGEAFRRERWLVILGDPGSGKTTLARWLALKLALGLRDAANPDEALIVPAHQIDPDKAPDDTAQISLGVLRLPVLLRVADYAEALARARVEGRGLPIESFLGAHKGFFRWQAPPLPERKINRMIREFIGRGQAVIMLDGMDEITESTQRDDVIRAIESFTSDQINARGRLLPPEMKAFEALRLAELPPAEHGGNQIVVTSRIAGYHAAPLTGGYMHVTIQPMGENAVRHFCDLWMGAAMPLKYPGLPAEEIDALAEQQASGLKAQIFNPARPRIRELATNPLLITILALVYLEDDRGQLPAQRAELYRRAINILVNVWRQKQTGLGTGERFGEKLSLEQIIYVLAPVAAWMHETTSRGYITAGKLREIIRPELATIFKKDEDDLALQHYVDTFLTTVQEDAGLLAERGKDLYGFLHLTFQEYLAGRHLVRVDRRHEMAATQIIEKLPDPRWREPILLALGYVSTDELRWGPASREKLLEAMLQADDTDNLRDLLPRSALLIVKAIGEMGTLPARIIEDITERLLYAYADKDGLGQYDDLMNQVQSAFRLLYENDTSRPILIKVLGRKLRRDPKLALAAADLLRRNRWYDPDLLGGLIEALQYDDDRADFPVTNTLREMLKPQMAAGIKIPKAPTRDAKVEKDLTETERKLTALDSERETLLAQIASMEADFERLQADYEAEQKRRAEESAAQRRQADLLRRQTIPELVATLERILASPPLDEAAFSAALTKLRGYDPTFGSGVKGMPLSVLYPRLRSVLDGSTLDRLQKDLANLEATYG